MTNLENVRSSAALIVGRIALVLTVSLAVFGALTLFKCDSILRNVSNTGACEETCTVMDLERVDRFDSCWCGDEDHTIRVSPYAWQNPDGTRTGRVIADTVEVQVQR